MDRKEEEAREIEKHRELYQIENDDNLKMDPYHWEKLRHIKPPCGGYHLAAYWMGKVEGLRVLDMGCGDGWFSVALAGLGATVSGIDISPEAIDIAERRAVKNGVAAKTDFVAGSAYELPYPDNSFDLVMGMAILHHLRDKAAASAEVYRVLKPGARAIFFEAFGQVEWLERMRLRLPVASEAEEDPDHWREQMTYDDVRDLTGDFTARHQEVGLLSRLERIVPFRSFRGAFSRIDDFTMRALPFTRKYARSIVVELRKPISGDSPQKSVETADEDRDSSRIA